MTDQIAATQPTSPATVSVTLDGPVMMGTNVLIEAGTDVIVRKPDSGTLRGLSLSSVNRLETDALEMLLPRITTPMIVKGAVVEGSDLMQLGGAVMDFLLPSAVKVAIRSAYLTE